MHHHVAANENKPCDFDCIVIGAGPGGLSASYYLRQHGLRYCTLEKGEIGQSWIDMSTCFGLITPMWTNALPGDRWGLFPFGHLSCNQYGTYLQRYAEKHQLNVQVQTTIKRLETTSPIIKVHTNRGILTTQTVISATGYFSNPYLPAMDINSSPDGLVMHAAQFKSVRQLLDRHVNSVLIVGKRNTAGQLLVELHRAGLQVSLAMRSPLVFRDNTSLKGRVKEFLYFYWETLLIRRQPNLRQNSYPPMDSREAQPLIESGTIGLYPNVQRICGQTVHFEDQTTGNFDAVIFATGYHPELRHLPEYTPQLPRTLASNHGGAPPVQNWEKQRIFLLGIDNLYNFRSRYIRGLCQDARVVVRKVNEAVTTPPGSCHQTAIEPAVVSRSMAP